MCRHFGDVGILEKVFFPLHVIRHAWERWGGGTCDVSGPEPPEKKIYKIYGSSMNNLGISVDYPCIIHRYP